MPILDAVTVSSLAAGDSYVYAFPNKITSPDTVFPTTNTSITVVSMTASSVTFRNDGSSTATAVFLLTWYYGEASRDASYQSLALGWDGSNSAGGGGGTDPQSWQLGSGANVIEFENQLIQNIEEPVTGQVVYVRVASNWDALTQLPTAAESTAQYFRVDSPYINPIAVPPTREQHWAQYIEIMPSVDNTETGDAAGGGVKVIHRGRGGDAYDTILMGEGAVGYEAATYFADGGTLNGTKGFIATLQVLSGTKVNAPNATFFTALWESQVVPNYGLLLFQQASGHAITIERFGSTNFGQDGTINEGQAMIRIVTSGYARNLWTVYNSGRTDLAAQAATSGTTLRNSPELTLLGTYWDAGASHDRSAQMVHAVASTTDSYLTVKVGAPNAEVTVALFRNNGGAATLDLQTNDIAGVGNLTMVDTNSVIDMQQGSITTISAITGDATTGMDITQVYALTMYNDGLGSIGSIDLNSGSIINGQLSGITSFSLVGGGAGTISANGGTLNMGGGSITNAVYAITALSDVTSIAGAAVTGMDLTNVDDITMLAGGGSIIDLQGGDITQVDDITMAGAGSILNMNGGTINGIASLVMAGNLDMQAYNLVNVDYIEGVPGNAVQMIGQLIAASADTDFKITSGLARVAGNLLAVQNNGADRFLVDYNGNITPAGFLYAPNGTSALPSITFVNDPDTGLSTDGTNTMDLSSGGNTVVRVDTAQVTVYQLLQCLGNLDLQNNDIINVDSISYNGAGNIDLQGGAVVNAVNVQSSTAQYDIYANGGEVFAEFAVPADGETTLLLRRNVGGSYTLQRVSMGAADSGGTGYKVLRVPN
jgi:hypothetical protein